MGRTYNQIAEKIFDVSSCCRFENRNAFNFDSKYKMYTTFNPVRVANIHFFLPYIQVAT